MNSPRVLRTGVLLAGLSFSAFAASPRVYTLDADFDEGVLFNVNHDAPNNDQLQLNTAGDIQTLPVLYVANAAEDTISKIDTDSNSEVGRYRSWFGPVGQVGFVNHPNGYLTGPAPSRSAVDADGNCFVANRGFTRPPQLMKILNDTFIDRNGNGVVDTSTDINGNNVIDPGEIMPLGDTNGNGRVDQSEIMDERVAWIEPLDVLGISLCRSVSIAPNGNIWVGGFNSRNYAELSPVDASLISGPFPAHTCYGSLVDASNILWSASLSTNLGRLDTTTGAFTTFSHSSSGSNYGIGIGSDPTNSNNPMVILGANGGSSFKKFDIPTSGFSYPAPSVTPLGVSVDANNDVICSDAVGGTSFLGCSKFRADGTLIWSSGPQPGATSASQRGAIVDANGDVWTIHPDNDIISKFDGGTGAPLGTFPVGDGPYTYSDASGSSFIQTNPTGTWAVVLDAGERGAENCVISWNGSTDNGSSFEVIADASDTASSVGDFNPASATPALNGVEVPGIAGRYVYVRVRFISANQTSPILEDLTIACCPQYGDVNDDCCVDRTDLNLVLAEVRAGGNDPTYDVNGDGEVDIVDARRVAVLFCTPRTGDPCL